jgi:carbonic anhydrase
MIDRVSLSRRTLLTYGLAAVACPVCAGVVGTSLARAEGSHWSYEGEGAPEHWGSLSTDFKACDLGLEQTPIDIRGATGAELAGVAPSFNPMPLKILNNGHTIQANCEPGSRTVINGEPFDLLQFHFHHPSEHLLSGKAFDLELHFVHKSAAGRLAVLGVFIQPGAENAALAPIWAAMPKDAGEEQAAGVTITPGDLLPADRGFFRYHGSLTTPPCSEGVLWTVFKAPIEASPAQIRQFAVLFPVNARPAQPLNQRFLLESL